MKSKLTGTNICGHGAGGTDSQFRAGSPGRQLLNRDRGWRLRLHSHWDAHIANG